MENAARLEIPARLRLILGTRTIAELEREKAFAENRIEGIRAELDYDLKRLVAREIGIDDAHIVVGDHLFHQAGRERLSKVLKSPEFVEARQKAETEIFAQREKLAECTELLDQARGVFDELGEA